MKILFLIIVLILIVSTGVFFLHNSKDNATASIDNGMEANISEPIPLPFEDGEKLIYDVYSKGIKIGKSVLTFHGEEQLNNEKAHHISFLTNIPFFEDSEEIYAQKDTFLPLKVERTLKKVGGITTKIIEEYDQENFEVSIKKQGLLRTKKEVIKRDSPIYNAILMTYYCRLKPEAAKNEPFKIVLPTSEYEVQVSGDAIIKTSKEEYAVTVYSSTPSKFTFYLSTNSNRVPVKIESHTALDYTMILSSIGNNNA